MKYFYHIYVEAPVEDGVLKSADSLAWFSSPVHTEGTYQALRTYAAGLLGVTVDKVIIKTLSYLGKEEDV